MTTLNVRSKKQQTAETPSEQLIKKADSAVTIDTPNGFKVTLKKPGVLSQFRLVKMLGDAAKNQVYVGMMLPMTYVSEIDGRAIAYPNSERELEALITRLDEEGVNAVMNGVAQHFGGQADPEAAKADIKN